VSAGARANVFGMTIGTLDRFLVRLERRREVDTSDEDVPPPADVEDNGPTSKQARIGAPVTFLYELSGRISREVRGETNSE